MTHGGQLSLSSASLQFDESCLWTGTISLHTVRCANQIRVGRVRTESAFA